MSDNAEETNVKVKGPEHFPIGTCEWAVAQIRTCADPSCSTCLFASKICWQAERARLERVIPKAERDPDPVGPDDFI